MDISIKRLNYFTCNLISYNQDKILFDPSYISKKNLSELQPSMILISHESFNHLDYDQLHTLVSNTDVKIGASPTVCGEISARKWSNDILKRVKCLYPNQPWRVNELTIYPMPNIHGWYYLPLMFILWWKNGPLLFNAIDSNMPDWLKNVDFQPGSIGLLPFGISPTLTAEDPVAMIKKIKPQSVITQHFNIGKWNMVNEAVSLIGDSPPIHRLDWQDEISIKPQIFSDFSFNPKLDFNPPSKIEMNWINSGLNMPTAFPEANWISPDEDFDKWRQKIWSVAAASEIIGELIPNPMKVRLEELSLDRSAPIHWRYWAQECLGRMFYGIFRKNFPDKPPNKNILDGIEFWNQPELFDNVLVRRKSIIEFLRMSCVGFIPKLWIERIRKGTKDENSDNREICAKLLDAKFGVSPPPSWENIAVELPPKDSIQLLVSMLPDLDNYVTEMILISLFSWNRFSKESRKLIESNFLKIQKALEETPLVGKAWLDSYTKEEK